MSYSPQSRERGTNITPQNRHVSVTSAGDFRGAPVSRQPLGNLQGDGLSRGAPALPSLASLTGEAENNRDQGSLGSPRAWRSLGVRNILNPASEAQAAQTQPLQHSPQIGSRLNQHGSQQMPNTSPHVRKRGEPHSPVIEPPVQHGVRPGRRILTPRSPGLRAASLGTHRSPSTGAGLISRVPLPSGDGRGYTAEPGDNRDAAVPPLPPLATARGAHGGPSSRDLISPGMHVANANPAFPRPGGMAQQPESRVEPARQAYPGGEASSSGFPQSQAPGPQPPVGAGGSGGESQTNYMSAAPGPIRSGLPYGQAEYQLTFETQQGPVVVPVNVDYQQASRLADEKRKRNAGASARFRARRKEKEREANQTISGLQQELQDLMDEREFYRGERNFFREMLARTGPLPARPHSPQARRSHIGGGSTAPDTSPSIDYSRHEAELSAPQRRRTGEYQPSLTSQSPSTPYDRPYPPAGPALNLPTPTAGNNFSDPRAGPPASRAPPYDPLRRNVLDRDWNAGR